MNTDAPEQPNKPPNLGQPADPPNAALAQGANTTRLVYTDLDGNEHELDVQVKVELENGRSSLNPRVTWQELKLVVRSQGRIVGRQSLDYRGVS